MKKRRIMIRLSSILFFCIFSLFVFLPASAFAACPEEMTSYWKLDGELNPPYLNEIDPGFDGICRAPGACPSPTTDGAVGDGAQEFERFTQTTGTGINVPGSAVDAPFNWAATDSFTIEYWIKREPGGFTSNEVVVGRNINPTTGLHWWTGLTSSGVAAFELLDRSNNGPARVDGTSNLADGEWHHVVAVRDADQNKNLLYVDGVLENSADFNYGTGDGFGTLAASLNIGWLNLSNGFHFNGTIDEVALYDVALPQSIIVGHYVLMIPYCDNVTSSIGVFRNGSWYLDANGSRTWDAGDITIPAGSFGNPNDIPITGDWNGDGITNIGVFRNGNWYLDANGSGTWDAGDVTIPAGSFGNPNDIPVTGDWNGDGITNIGVFRNGNWYLDANGSRTWDAGDITIPAGSFGNPNDIPITGDWNGDGITNIGVFRNGNWYLDANGSRTWDAGDVTISAGSFGNPNDIPVTGDWNGDGITNIGVFRNGNWYLDANGSRTWDAGDVTISAGSFGNPNDIPITGVWSSGTGSN
jgi:hypothetical protein